MDKEEEIVKPVSKVIQTSGASVWLGEDGVLRVMLCPGIVLGVDGVKENEAARVEILGYKKIPLLIDMREIKAMTQEARDYAAGQEHGERVSALAILENSPVSNFIGNVFIKLSHPVYPTRLFSSEEQALEWLKGFID